MEKKLVITKSQLQSMQNQYKRIKAKYAFHKLLNIIFLLIIAGFITYSVVSAKDYEPPVLVGTGELVQIDDHTFQVIDEGEVIDSTLPPLPSHLK